MSPRLNRCTALRLFFFQAYRIKPPPPKISNPSNDRPSQPRQSSNFHYPHQHKLRYPRTNLRSKDTRKKTRTNFNFFFQNKIKDRFGTSKRSRFELSVKEVYNLQRGGYGGRSTVPMLWDGGGKEVLCNESYDIIEFFNSELNDVARNPGLDLSPPPLKMEIDRWNKIIYPNVNNGVYRCGFAQSQEAYDMAAKELFGTLDVVEEHLGGNRYLCGDTMTLADVCLFTTLVRFDLVYNVLFKCTKKKLIEYPNLHGYMRDIYQIPGVAETCNFGAIMDGYYKILFPLNPGGIRPAIPSGCEYEALSKPHNREVFSYVDDDESVLVS